LLISFEKRVVSGYLVFDARRLHDCSCSSLVTSRSAQGRMVSTELATSRTLQVAATAV